ncbi:MAG: 30S ribosome-binding factor RbfA, partial [Clostridia bacterium]|nr:30S ribosome-binding factor RbfA [Clostridia bacterium]
MAKYRRGRINDAVKAELSSAIGELTDPRIAGALVSVTRAEVSPDLKNATVYFSAMGDQKEVKRALIGATGALRRALASRLNLRITPELSFVFDESLAHGARIAELLEQIHRDDEKFAKEAKDEP